MGAFLLWIDRFAVRSQTVSLSERSLCSLSDFFSKADNPKIGDYYFARSWRTTRLIVFPSALPANCLVATPITLPMSWGPVAPT